MRYAFLTGMSAVVGWARRLVAELNTRDNEIERRLESIEQRLDAGGL